ncbi:MAG: hypothetical protein MHM6MM_007764 [Cercozoa sp. M6MM]
MSGMFYVQQGVFLPNFPRGHPNLALNIPSRGSDDARTVTDVCSAFLKTEDNYVNNVLFHLRNLKRRLEQLVDTNHRIVDQEMIDRIFLNVLDLAQYSEALFRDLVFPRYQGEPLPLLIGQALAKHSEYLKLYRVYMMDFEKALQLYRMTAQKNRKFKEFIEEYQAISKVKSVRELLREPAKRLHEYLTACVAIEHKLKGADDTETLSKFQRCGTTVRDTYTFVVRELWDMRSQRMIGYCEKVIYKEQYSLRSTYRKVLRYDILQKQYARPDRHKTPTKDYLLVVFNDMIVYGEGDLTPSSKCKIKHCIPLQGLRVTALTDGSNGVHKETQFPIPKSAFSVSHPKFRQDKGKSDAVFW